MRQLRLVAVSEDGTSLVLASLSEPGEEQRFRLTIDERLRAAVQLDRLRLGQLEIKVESSLRPREIQARIRAGEPAESVARDAGVPVEHIRRFEGPVLREREHIADEARGTRVRRGDTDLGPLGELVDARLRAQGVADDAVRWDSWRLDDGTWTVEVIYRTDAGVAPRARWRFDPLRRAIRPLGPLAAELVGEPADNVRAFAPRDVPPPLAPSPPPAGAPPAAPGAVLPSIPPDAPAGDPVASPPPGQDRVEAAGAGESAAHEAPAQPEAEAAAPPAAAAASGAATGTTGRPPAGRRRASVPSWDDIMFGARPPE
ncbi:MAG TPA: septation protein SepH [Mycobacteriales bacterium]|nr:septation protein SepH [Mycobacteriales bacterium]